MTLMVTGRGKQGDSGPCSPPPALRPPPAHVDTVWWGEAVGDKGQEEVYIVMAVLYQKS